MNGVSPLLVKNPLQFRRSQFNFWIRKISWRRDRIPTPVFMSFSGGSDSQEPTCNAGDLGSIPGLERFPVGGHGNPLQYSCLENPHRQRILAGYRLWGHKELDMTEWLSTQYSVGPTNHVWILYFTPACHSFIIIHLFLFLIFFIYFIEWLVYSRILGYIHSKQKSQTLHLPVAYISLLFSAPDHPLTSTLCLERWSTSLSLHFRSWSALTTITLPNPAPIFTLH